MTNRTPDLRDYTFTDLVIWDPRFPHDGDSAPTSGSYPVSCFEPASADADARQANEDGTLYLRVPYCSGGDYCGTAVDLANYREFTETYGDRVGVVETTSFPGGFGIMVKLSTLDNDDEMLETVNALYDYPVIDDERLVEIEQELIEESFSDYHDDARKRLIARYDDNATVADRVEDAIDAMDYQVFMRELTMVGIEMGEEWICETPTSAHIDVEKIIDSMSDEDVATLLGITADDLVAKPNLPPTDDLVQLVSAVLTQNTMDFELAAQWHEKHEDDDDYSEDDEPEYGFLYLDLTVSIDTEGDDEDAWSYQTGDNSFTGGAYSYPDWAVTSLSADSDPAEVAEDIRRELAELFYQR